MLLMIHKPRATPAERALAGLSRAASALLAGIDAVVMWPFRAAENRRVIETLGAMSDHDLRDSLALPPTSDAGTFLAARRSARRR